MGVRTVQLDQSQSLFYFVPQEIAQPSRFGWFARSAE